MISNSSGDLRFQEEVFVMQDHFTVHVLHQDPERLKSIK